MLKFYIGYLLLLLVLGCATDNTPKPKAVPPITDPMKKIVITWDINSLSGGNTGSFVPVIDVDNSIFTADGAGYIYKIDSSDGTTIFSFKLEHRLSSGTAISSDTIFVTTEDDYLLAIGMVNHDIKWKAKLPTLSIEAPQVVNNTVVVRTNDASILAYNAQTGALLWIFQRPIPTLTLRATSTFQIAASGDVIIAGQPGGRISVINLLNGSSIWDTFVAIPEGATDLDKLTDIDMRPVLSGKEIYVGSYNGRIACLDAITSNPIWSNKFSTSTQLLLDEQNVYAISQDGVVYAFDKNNGNIVWKNDVLQYRVLSSPALLNANLIIVDYDGYINVFDKKTGVLSARISSNLTDGASYPISNGYKVIIQSASGNLAAITE